MPNFFKQLLVLCGCMLCLSAAQARTGRPTTFVGPTLQGNYSGWFLPNYAYSFLGEVGSGNYRVSVGGGTKIDDVQRIKVNAEYLWQRIRYDFFTPSAKEWMQQFAVGADYQYATGCEYSHFLNLKAYVTHSPSNDLSSREVVLTTDGISSLYLNSRRIAGANAWGIAPGIGYILWTGGLLGIDLNYDDVRYTKTFVPMHYAKGLGGTAYVEQPIGDHLRVGLLYARRKPFINYHANINWDNLYYRGRWSLGVFGDYLRGRIELPSTWNAGVSVNFYADCNIRPPVDHKNEALSNVPQYGDQKFLNWVADPAVHMPQVYAITDQQLRVIRTPV